MRRQALSVLLVVSILILVVASSCSKHARIVDSSPQGAPFSKQDIGTSSEQLPDPGEECLVVINENFPNLTVFTSGNPYRVDVSGWSVDSAYSDSMVELIATMGDSADTAQRFVPFFGAQYGVPYVGVGDCTPRVAVATNSYSYAGSDSGPYPIPEEARTTAGYMKCPTPGGSLVEGEDCHLFLVDRDNLKLYELWKAYWDPTLQNGQGQWTAGYAVEWDLNAPYTPRALGAPGYGNSASSSGMPLFPGFVRFDEVMAAGEINHGFCVSVYSAHGNIPPATHGGYRDNGPPTGTRLRLKNTTEVNAKIAGVPARAQKIFRAMQRYGVIIVDETLGVFSVNGTWDSRWPQALASTGYSMERCFHPFTARDFEVVHQ